MKFKKTTIKLMKYFLKDFNTFCDCRDSDTQKSMDKILTIIYNDIKLSSIYIEAACKEPFVDDIIKEIRLVDDIPQTHLLNSKLIPSNIRNYINHMSVGYFKASIFVSSIKVNIYFLMFDAAEFNNIKIIKKKIREAVKIIRFCYSYTKRTSIESIDLFLYLTHFNKEIPKNKLAVLGGLHYNSSVSISCQKKSEVLVFRNEEWKKVLIHELFHCLCLDFSGLNYKELRNTIKNIFNVKSNFDLSEAYTEFWSTIINSCMISYTLLEDKNDIECFFLYSEFCIQFEKIFSLYQCVKILNYMGLHYPNLYKTDQLSKSLRKLLYKDNDNVFSYYIIKLILLYHSDEFMEWCLINNTSMISFDKSPLTYRRFGNFIKNNYNKIGFLNKIKKMEVIFYKIHKNYAYPAKDMISKTSRITICELD